MNRHVRIRHEAGERVARRVNRGVELQRQLDACAGFQFDFLRRQRHIGRVIVGLAAHAQLGADRRRRAHIEEEFHGRHRARLHRQHHRPSRVQRHRLAARRELRELEFARGGNFCRAREIGFIFQRHAGNVLADADEFAL